MASVGSAIMLREEASRLLLYLLIVFLVTFSKTSSYVLRDNCLEFDVVELEDYLSRNIENVPTIDMMIGGFKCPVTALPFGALKSDWARLLLLQRAQPKDSILSKKLGRLFRILVIAYFQIEERFDIIQSGILSSVNNIDTRKEMKRFNNSIIDLGEVDKNFTANFTFFDNKKSIGTIKIERTTRLDITRENKNDNFNTTRSNNSSTTVEFLSIDDRMVFRSTTERYEEKKMVNITGFSDINTEKKNYTEISKANESIAIEIPNNFTKGQGGKNIYRKKEELNKNKDDTLTATDISGISVSNSNQKSIVKNMKEEGTTRSVFTTKISTMKSDGMEERDSKKMSDRSDYDYVTKFNLERIENVNSLEIFDAKTTSEPSRVYSNKISTNSSESFNQSPSNRQTNDVFEKIPWNFSNKLEKPPIYKKLRKPSLDNDFWKYIVISRNVVEPKMISEIENADKSEESSTKSKKRASLNTEKNLRWFYNFGHEDNKQYSNNPADRQGIYIECNGKK
ncbi:uncharacterized protein LOC122714686 isoform X2 [Apis laboriosa]|uniref:uncharacterized protein LOC122714686 isoform X2 n=1 Tax=Apis laboriosa TaxID=183418 RepID=UPI001CC48EBC|nr:uncharacterized protein LOC122714686 isoform X2 [Apis laboriosa]